MPRKPLIRTREAVYHVSSRSNNKESFYLPLREVWKIFCDNFNRYMDLGVKIHAFVLMPNHFHMLVSTPDLNLDFWLGCLLTQVCKGIQKRSKRINHVFGGRYRPTLLWEPYHVAYGYKYVMRNPVKAGLCARVEDYGFSTLSKDFQSKSLLQVSEGTGPLWSLLNLDVNERLNWMNAPTPKEHDELIKRAMRRFEFKIPESNLSRKKITEFHYSYGNRLTATFFRENLKKVSDTF